MRTRAAILLLALTAPSVVVAQSEAIDYATLARIRDEGLQRSQAMETITWLSDIYGPRLTGSPGIRQAADWTKKRMAGWGLSNIHEESWPFGKGWSLTRFSAQMTEPQVMPIIGWPKAWSAGTDGAVTAEVVLASVRSEADLAQYHGKLRGKIVLTQPARAVRMLDGRIVLRMNDADIAEAETMPVSEPRAGGGAAAFRARAELARRVEKFWKDEGVVATIDRGSDSDMSAGGSDLSWQTQRVDGGTVFVQGTSRGADVGQGVPTLTIAVEHYNRMVRILEHGVPVKMALDVAVRFHDETPTALNGFNLVAEIPGTDPKLRDEIVMLGAHFDSWHSATGATDNATGSTAMLEAMRILRAVDAKPRRTIRIALWGGEEEGTLGSRAYVDAHFFDRGTARPKPEHEKLSAYYNLDNGTGKIRGIWMQGNLGVRPIFAQFIEPLKELGVTILGPRSVSSTDHDAFDAAGLPGFQFVQERLEYNSRTHHSNMDFVDHVQPADLMQQAVVAASFAYLTAMRDERLPRKSATTATAEER